mgnify:CR=1 FL=1
MVVEIAPRDGDVFTRFLNVQQSVVFVFQACARVAYRFHIEKLAVVDPDVVASVAACRGYGDTVGIAAFVAAYGSEPQIPDDDVVCVLDIELDLADHGVSVGSEQRDVRSYFDRFASAGNFDRTDYFDDTRFGRSFFTSQGGSQFVVCGNGVRYGSGCITAGCSSVFCGSVHRLIYYAIILAL